MQRRVVCKNCKPPVDTQRLARTRSGGGSVCQNNTMFSLLGKRANQLQPASIRINHIGSGAGIRVYKSYAQISLCIGYCKSSLGKNPNASSPAPPIVWSM